MPKTGQPCVISGVYLAACRCGTERRLRVGDRVPACPSCARAVDWLILVPPHLRRESIRSREISRRLDRVFRRIG